MGTRKNRKLTAFKLAGMLGITLFPMHASRESHAATVTWDNGGPTDNWSTASGNTNWLPGNTLWVNGNSAIFGATPEAVSVTTANTVQDITFQGSWSISNGAGSLSTVAATQSVVTVDPTFTATILESIGGTGGVTKAGTGTLVLQFANNTYTGATVINDGTVRVEAVNAIPTASALTINANGTLSLSGTVANARLDKAAVEMTGGQVTGGANPNIFAGFGGSATGLTFNVHANVTSSVIETVRLQANVGTTGSGLLTFNTESGARVNVSSSFVSGTGSGTPASAVVQSLLKTGVGTLSMSGNSSYSGTTTISAGTLLAGGNADSFATTVLNSAVTVNAGTDVISGVTLSNGDRVFFSQNNGTAPGGLTANGIYYVRDVSGSTFKISATPGGTAVDLTSNGSSVLVSRTGGVLGSTNSAIVLGNGTTAASDAPALLVDGAFTIARPITVGSVANTAAYNATLGGSNTTGTSVFTGNITLNTTAANYTTTLQAATGGTVEFSTGTWTTNNKTITVGATGKTGTVKISNALSTTGGVNVTAGTLQLGAADALSATTPVTVSGGTFDLATFNDSVSAVSLQSGAITGSGTLTSGTAFDVQSGSVNAVLNSSAGLVKSTAGVVTLSGANTYTGTTNVNAGTLALSGAGTISDTLSMVAGSTVDLTAKTGALSLANLLGAGSIVGGNSVTVSTALTPGTSPGTLSIANNFGLSSTALLTWELNAGNQAVGSGVNDLVAVTGNLTLDGTLDVNGIGSFAGVTSGTWTIATYTGGLIDNGLLLGTLPTLDPGYQWSLNSGTGSNSAVTLSIAAIPEPSTFVIGSLIALGLMTQGMRRRARVG